MLLEANKLNIINLRKSWNEGEHPRDDVGRFTSLYHWTSDKDFKYDPNYKNTKQEMGAGFYATALDDAMYWHKALQDDKGNRPPYAIPVDASEAKLIHRNDIPSDHNTLAKHLINHYGGSKAALAAIEEEEAGISGDLLGSDPFIIAQQRLYAKSKGYHGIIMHDDREGNQVVFMDASKLKFGSAITDDDVYNKQRAKNFPGLFTDEEVLNKALTRADAKKVHKDLPEGGQWRTMNGHHIYVLNGKVLAGAVPAVKGAKKATKAQLAEHQANVDKEAKAAKKKAPATKKTAKAAPKATDKKKKAEAEAAKSRKAIDELAGQNAKANAKVKKKTVEEARAESKKATDEALKNPNKKPKQGKAATKKDLDEVVKENAKRPKSTAKEATKADLDKLAAESKKKPAAKPVTKEDLDEMFGTSEPKSKGKGKKVADVRTEKQTKNDVAYDVGNKIVGARKDTATKKAVDNLINRNSGQSLEELEAISPELAQKHCTKKNLLTPVDFKAEHDAGTEVNVAMAKQLIYDRIAPKPRGDTPKDRAEYLNAIKSIQRVLEPIKSWDEFKKAVYSLGDHMKAETPRYLQDQKHYLDYAEKEYNREPNKQFDLRKYNYKTSQYEDLTPEQWKADKLKRVNEIKAAIANHHELAKAPYSPLGEKLTNFFTSSESRNRTFDTIASKKLSWDKYFTAEKAASEAPKEAKGEANKRKWEREMPAAIQRKGGRVSKVEKPEDMIKDFGFSGVQFGNWVDDTSGNFHMKKCAEAFKDLADIIGVKDKDVSFNGKLSMAFGARGKGGALAHYEPSGKVINITKEGGAGSLAHEWGHAMDNMMYQQSVGRSSLNLAANGMGDEGDPAVKAAYKDVMEAMLTGNGKETVENKSKTYYSYHPSFKKAVEEVGVDEAIKKATELLNSKHKSSVDYYNTSVRSHYGNDTADKYIAKEERKHKMALNDMVQEMAYHHEKITGEHLDEIPMYTGKSQYYVDSSKLGGAGNKYWTSNEEMFARAFENYIEGKMKSGKVKNDYLVHGTYAGFPAPFPRGEEREKIHKAFDKLMDAIRKSGAIQKALAIMELEKSLENHDRNAYNIMDTSEVFFIPVNRLRFPYQTDEALNFDKIKENVERMKNGENLEPVVIGYDYDVHDGHHRVEATKIMNYTHVPCIVGGSNPIDVQRAKEAYSEVWKSLNI